MSPEADLRTRPSMHTHAMDIEKSFDQAAPQFNIWKIWAMDRTLAQPQVNLSLLSLLRSKKNFEIPASVGSNKVTELTADSVLP